MVTTNLQLVEMVILVISLELLAVINSEDEGTGVKLIMFILMIYGTVLSVITLTKDETKLLNKKEVISTEELKFKIKSLEKELDKCDKMLKITEEELDKYTGDGKSN
jgi:hypothetical protein